MIPPSVIGISHEDGKQSGRGLYARTSNDKWSDLLPQFCSGRSFNIIDDVTGGWDRMW